MSARPSLIGSDGVDELERIMRAEPSGLRRLAAAAVACPDASAALCVAAEEIAALMGVEQGFVFRFERNLAIVAGAHGIERSPIGAAHGMLGAGVLPEVMRTRAPARAEYALRPLGRESSHQCVIGPVYRSGIGAPVFVGERLAGAVVAASTGEASFPLGAEERLGCFGEIAGIAIGNAEASAGLAALATTDGLTGLANHRAFHASLVCEVERARRHGRPVSLAVIDVDHFKRVNDAHGHLAGDRVLVEVARRLARVARPGDVVARVGGEEFAWIIPDTDLAGAQRAAERVRRAIGGAPFAGVGGLTVSIGIAEAGPTGGAPGLYGDADAALFVAKRSGRDRTHPQEPAEGLPAGR